MSADKGVISSHQITLSKAARFVFLFLFLTHLLALGSFPFRHSPKSTPPPLVAKLDCQTTNLQDGDACAQPFSAFFFEVSLSIFYYYYFILFWRRALVLACSEIRGDWTLIAPCMSFCTLKKESPTACAEPEWCSSASLLSAAIRNSAAPAANGM